MLRSAHGESVQINIYVGLTFSTRVTYYKGCKMWRRHCAEIRDRDLWPLETRSSFLCVSVVSILKKKAVPLRKRLPGQSFLIKKGSLGYAALDLTMFLKNN